MTVLLTQILFSLLLAYFVVSYLSVRLENSLLEIASRWVRWVLFALAIAGIFSGKEADPHSMAFWRLAGGAFLLWFLLETVYNWVLISALSRSSIPLFPRFRPNINGDEWPMQRHLLLLREWLRARGFRREQSLKSSLGEEVTLRYSVYLNDDSTIRLCILFTPRTPNRVDTHFTLSTQTRENELVITDNINLPFGGYYPENWFLERKPLVRSLEKLLHIHKRRLLRGGVNVERWPQDTDIAEVINDQQKLLEDINTEAGFVFDRRYQEACGRLTTEGRYRLWKEMWLLKYFGITL